MSKNTERLAEWLQEIRPERIAIIKPSALGDIVQTLPLLNVLKCQYPKAEIDWVIRSELTDLLTEHPHISQVLPYYRRGGLRAWRKLLGNIWGRNYDLVFDLQGLLRTGIMTAASRASLRIGLQTAREGAHLFCNATLPNTSKNVPAHARYWKLAEYLGLQDCSKSLNLCIPAEMRAEVQQLLPSSDRNLLVIHPGAMWVTKRWPAENFAEIALRLIDHYQWRVAVVGSKGEANEAATICQQIRNLIPAASLYNLAGQTTLRQLAIVMENADLVLSNDSGPMHLAAGMGTPVVGLFTCTSAERSGPAGNQHVLLQAKVPCAASYRKQCPFPGQTHLQCMQVLSLHQVWQGMQKAIDKNQLQQRAA